MDRHENRLISISRQDWSFNRRGEQDSARHDAKVKQSIIDRLDQVISDGSIITADPHSKKTIKIPMRSLELPRFIYGEEKDGVGSGDGTEQEGQVIGGKPKPGKGKEAGDQPGEEYYETQLTIEEIQEMVFADLGLPRVKPKDANDIESDYVKYDDVRKKRTTSNLDLGRTVMQNIMRNVQETGVAKIGNITSDDYRVRIWEEEKRPENSAVVIAMADISGSMGDNEKYITRAFCWWAVGFLRSKYPKVDIVFVAHDTEASEVTEEQFFGRGSGGGTKCSSANRLARDIINERYPANRYNVYPLHFSDGDNWSGDNEKCVDLVQEMLDNDVNQYAYIQIGATSQSGLLSQYNTDVTDERFKGLIINSKQDVLPALKKVFNPEEKAV
jgi:sporulation protein YhbH